jgi:transposase
MKKRQPVDVNLEQLDEIVDASRERALADEERASLKTALHAMADRLTPQFRNSEKSRDVLGSPEPVKEEKEPKPGHGRNGSAAFTGAKKVLVPHPTLQPGCVCPGCVKGKVYSLKQGPAPRIRFVGQAPIQATIYELGRLRCNLCGEVFTAEPPEGVGDDKYDESVTSMIAQLKYGRGLPFNRIAALQQQVGVPLPAPTQWELVEDGAELLKPAHAELIHQAAQAEVLHGDDTHVNLLKVERLADDGRTGLFTTSIVAAPQSGGTGPTIALFFSGTQHAGENLRDLLQHRAADLHKPIFMSDALAANASKLSKGAEILLANCLAHGRRKVVEVADGFPKACRHILEELGEVYGYDEAASQQGLDPKQRLRFHQENSAPVMKRLKAWMTAELDEKRVEPNSRLGKALRYLLTHWEKLTLFLRHPGAPLDNNICERAIKKAVLHRKNALFYRTLNGAQVGDLYMSLIHTCELNDVNSFEYLTVLQKHTVQVREKPSAWMPWNYRAELARAPD